MNTAFTVRINNLDIISQLSLFILNRILFFLLYYDGSDSGDSEKQALVVLGLSCPFVSNKTRQHLAGDVQAEIISAPKDLGRKSLRSGRLSIQKSVCFWDQFLESQSSPPLSYSKEHKCRTTKPNDCTIYSTS